MITVQGTLRDPLGNELAGAVIRFTAITSEGDTFKGIDAEAVTMQDGSYDFELQLGRYRLEVLHTDEYHESGTVLVDDNTPSPITLVQLWAYTSPLNPPLLNPDKPVWDELYQDVLKGDEWEREAEEQIRDTDVLVNEDKSIHKKGDAYLAKETLTTGIQAVTQTVQTTAYKDEYAQEASVSSQENTTRNAKASESLGSYTHSDGSTEVQKRVELIGSIGSTTEVRTEDVDTLDKVKGVQSTHLKESAGSTVSKYKHGNNEVSTTTAVQYMDADKFVQALIEQNVRLTYSNNGFPVEAFNRLLVNPHGSTNTIQADKHIIQAVDGFPVATFDTANREIIFDSKLTFQNRDDFIGEEGWSYDWDFEYSNDQLVWKPDYTFGDIWRKERKFKFKEADPEGTKQYIGEAIIVQLNARDGVDGDNYYLEYEYTTAQSYPSGWRPNFTSGDDWRRWRSVRITPTGTEISKWQEEPMKGTDGPEGWIPEYQIFYGPDATKPLYTDQDTDGSLDDINLAHWHQNMSEGDLYKFERRVWWKSQADFNASRTNLTKVPHVIEPWNGPNKIMPVAGEDYGDRFATLYLYKRAATKPSDDIGVWRYNFDSLTLEPVNGNYLGWSTSVVDGLEHLWVATGTAHSLTSVDDSIDNWDVDKLTSNGLKTATAYLYKLSDGATTSVALPTNALTYNFLTGLVEGTPTNGWLATPPNNTTEQGKLWRTFAPVTAEAFTTREPVAANDWETATVLAQSGSNGSNGSNGVHGFSNALVYLYKRSSSAGNLPSTTSTYTFSTKTLTGFNNGWSTTIPGGSGTIWVTVATASSIGDTDTIAANEWAGAVQFSENGVSITGVVNYYAKHTSNITYPTIGSASWTTSVPTVDATNKYLWNYEQITYSSGSPTNTPPAVIGTFGEKGIKSITEYYLLNNVSTGVTNSSGNWVTTPQVTTPSNRYLWNYELITYTDDSTTKTNAVVIGVHGEQGVGITTVLNEYGLSNSTATEPTSWTTTVPTTTASQRYLWNREKVTYSNASTITTPAAIIGTYSKDGKGIVSITEWYLVTNSTTVPSISDSGWSTTLQLTSTSNKYLWNKEVIKYTEGSDVTTAPVIIGTHGADGANGVGITGVVNYYAKSSSATTSPTSWATAVPTLDVTNKYLWNYEKVTSSDGTSVSTPPAVIGTLSVDGVGISSVTEYYLVSSSSTGITTSTTGWTTTPQLTTTTNKYLWNYEKVTYSNNNVVNSTPVVIGTHGETGIGITGVTNYYAKSTSSTTAPTTWATTVPVLDTTNKYLWNYEKVTRSDGSSIDSVPAVIGTMSVDGVGIKSVVEYYLASTSSSGVTVSTSGWTTTIQTTDTSKRFLWNYEVTTYTDNSTTTTTPVIIGTHGATGANGVGVAGVVNEYAKHTSATTAPTSGWSTAVPTLDSTNKYLWNRETVSYTSGSPTVTPAALIGTLSEDGKGIVSITEYYLASASSTGVTTATAGWTTTPQTTSTSKRYLWNYEVVKYTVGSDTITTPVIIGTHGETGPQGVAGTNGTNGVTTYTWIRYADTATGGGISNDPTGKLYIGFAYNKTTATESNTASDYTWSLIKGDKGDTGVAGAPGANGTTTYTWIKYSDNADGTGLYDVPTTSTNYIGIATNKTTATESTNKADYTWSLFKGANGANGIDGINAATIMVFQRTTGTPSKPSANVTYTFASGAVSGLNNGWTTTIPSGTAPVWVTTASALSQAATDTITPSEWATPVIMAQSGVDGKHGAGSYVITVTNATYIPNDAGKDNHILQLSARNAIAGDILTYKDSGKTFSKSYLRGASTWSEFEFVFDGSAIVNGTLAAEALKSGTSITDKLYISSTKNPAEMTLSGTSDWRIWLGNAVATSAPFRVDKWGNLTAANANLTNATVVGKVTATSGSFTGTVNASSGSFTGTVNANAGTMNNITIAENCNVLGTVYADRIVGDVYRKGYYSNRDIPRSIISGGSGDREFFRANIGSQPFAQRLVLSYVDAPVEMYDNPGKAEFYYQVEGQSPVWYGNIDGRSGARLPALINFSVQMPAGATWIRFFCRPFNKVTWGRTPATDGVLEVMKYEQVGISVTTN